MDILWLWLIVGIILAMRKRIKSGPLRGSTYLGIVLMWPFIYLPKFLDARF